LVSVAEDERLEGAEERAKRRTLTTAKLVRGDAFRSGEAAPIRYWDQSDKGSVAGKTLCAVKCMCANTHLYMAKKETSLEVKRWFQSTIRDLWPIAMGSLSLRKSPCIREHCGLCESGTGHSSYALYGRKGKRRFSIYVPDELAPELERAIENGRHLQESMMEAGRRYALALKNERFRRQQ
jgi:hypothetical protein